MELDEILITVGLLTACLLIGIFIGLYHQLNESEKFLIKKAKSDDNYFTMQKSLYKIELINLTFDIRYNNSHEFIPEHD